VKTVVLKIAVTLEPEDEVFLLANDEADNRIAVGLLPGSDIHAVGRLLDQDLLRRPGGENSIYLITEKGRRTIEALRQDLWRCQR
jgi:hypothetical protein